MLFFSQKSTTDLSAFVVWPWTTRLCPHITTVVWDEAVFCRKARVPGLGSASSILCPYGVCSWRPHPRSQFFRCQSPDFSPNMFFCKDSCARTKLPNTYLEFAFLHLAQFRWFGPSQSNRDSSPACSSSLLWARLVLCTWCSGQQCTGGRAPMDKLCLQWLFLEGGEPARNTSCSISAFPLFPISQSDAV